MVRTRKFLLTLSAIFLLNASPVAAEEPESLEQAMDAPAYQQRGIAHFKAGRIKESIADFDRYLQFRPAGEPHHWQRGISYYYAGQFEKGVKQFELHKTVNPQDVENGIWHYLCKARIDGVQAAKSDLIEITSDRRPWAMKVYAMFQAKVTPEEVLKYAGQVSDTDEERQINLFYSHLYVGLFYEAAGQADKARQYIATAIEKYPCSHYMGDVARVHLQLRKP